MQANFLIINYLNSRDLTWLGPVCTVVASSFLKIHRQLGFCDSHLVTATCSVCRPLAVAPPKAFCLRATGWQLHSPRCGYCDCQVVVKLQLAVNMPTGTLY